jgi:magnesium-transporting ATPase (P-type)
MITSSDMKTNESDLTGEKDELQKFPYEMKGDEVEGKPFAFKGTVVT